MSRASYNLIRTLAGRMAGKVYDDDLKTARKVVTDYSLSLFNAYTPELVKRAYREYPQYFQNSHTIYFKKKDSDDWIYTIPVIVDVDIPFRNKLEISEEEFNLVKAKNKAYNDILISKSTYTSDLIKAFTELKTVSAIKKAFPESIEFFNNGIKAVEPTKDYSELREVYTNKVCK